MIGTEIAHYRITAKLGEGGMGEVYRATDSKLGREVAIKVLPAAFTEDRERLARFEREAQVLASLNHPNIAAIYGIEEAGSSRALVMELVEGPTLADRLATGAIPLSESLAIARQIAEALEDAHEKGIVHRDLKPQNIKASIEGKTKVLDFGLAKAMDPTAAGSTSSSQLAQSPTLTMGATVQGMILGTAAYMSPEQAKGLAVDKRSDIWAFGVVLYEMLIGGSLFAGDTVGDTLAAVIRAEIDLDRLPQGTPPALRRLLSRCLERQPRGRLRDIGDARIVIEEILAGKHEEAPAAASVVETPASGAARWLPWAIAAAALIVGAVVGTVLSGDGGAPKTLRADLAPPADRSFSFQGDWGAPVALSPDGETIVFGAKGAAAGSSGPLWTRSLVTGVQKAIAGSEGGYAPFLSADARSVGFFAEGKLKTVPITGGPAFTLAEAANGRGGAWAPDGTIVYAPEYRSGLYVVPAAGGESRLLTTPDPARHSSHRWPVLTPDGKSVVFLAIHHSPEHEGDAGLRLVRLDGSGERPLIGARTNGALVGERLLFLRESTLFAQNFDASRGELRGDAVPVAQGVLVDPTTWRATFAATPRRLVHAAGDPARGSSLLRVNGTGRESEEISKRGAYGDIALSPDDRRLVVSRGERSEDLWMLDLERGIESRFTFDTTSETFPAWSPDGRWVYYLSTQHPDLRDRVLRKPASGIGDAELIYESSAEVDLAICEVSPDGSNLLVLTGTSPFDSQADLALLPIDGSGPPRPLLETEYVEGWAKFSPDGRLLALSSGESGIGQVYVVALAADAGQVRVTARWQVSVEGGNQPIWSRDGSELYFSDAFDNLMSVQVEREKGGAVRFGAPSVLFSLGSVPQRLTVAVDAEGRFLINRFGGEQSAPLKLVDNWAAGLAE